jgi:Fe-S-cluster-containing hydrogenase component 2
MFKKTGIATLEMIKEKFPTEERRKKGPYAVFECFQEIPCNPCYTSCKIKAVESIEEDINNIPDVNHDKCSGCSMCVSACPGLACFVIDETYSEDKLSLKIPYEFLPLPKEGDIVNALDREGNAVVKAEVLKVQDQERFDHTNVITLALPKEYIYSVRNIKVDGE